MELQNFEADKTVALVTGGASGLGEATVQRFHQIGARVAILDLPSSAGQKIADELNSVRSGSAIFVATDVSDRGQVDDAVRQATELGQIRIVVNSAGIAIEGRIVGENSELLTTENFEKIIDVNLTGTFNVLSAASAVMAKQEPIIDDFGTAERGVIINLSSVMAYDGLTSLVGYAASKGAVSGMTLPLARDLAGSLIRAVAIAPGVFDPDIAARSGGRGCGPCCSGPAPCAGRPS